MAIDNSKVDSRSAWDAESMGYGKHKFHHVDPDAINPEDYAQSMRGEQEHFGEVREYNSAKNEKHPENDVRLEDFARTGTVINTEAEGYEGDWMVVRMPAVRAPKTYARVAKATKVGEKEWDHDGNEVEIDTMLLGCAVDPVENVFLQVKSTIQFKGIVGKSQRERLTKR